MEHYDKAYALMSGAMINTSGNTCSATVNGLQDGQSYTYYARAIDSESNASSSSTVISFSVEEGEDAPAVNSFSGTTLSEGCTLSQ